MFVKSLPISTVLAEKCPQVNLEREGGSRISEVMMTVLNLKSVEERCVVTTRKRYWNLLNKINVKVSGKRLRYLQQFHAT